MNKKSLSLMLVGCVLAGLPLAIVTQGVGSGQKPQKDLGLDVPGISETKPMAQRQLRYEELYKRTREITVQVRSGDGTVQLGSGIIIYFQDNSYTVLTNEHVVKNSESYSIKTFRDKEYPAIRIVNNIFGKNDLAILQFTAKERRRYETAKYGDLNNVTAEEDYVFAAGYPANANPNDDGGFVFYRGRVLFRLPRPLKDGYQVGISNDFEKGMSGGPLVNRNGEVVGINGRHRPLWGGLGGGCTSYEYEDGTLACEDITVEPSSWTIPIETYISARLPGDGQGTRRPEIERPGDTDPGDRAGGDRGGTGSTQQDYLTSAKSVENTAMEQWEKAASVDDWREVEESWQEAIKILKKVPKAHNQYEEAEKKSKEYKDILKHVQDMRKKSERSREPQPDPYWAALREGRTASGLLAEKTREDISPSPGEWKKIAEHWRNGLSFLEKVLSDYPRHPQYEEAQKRIPRYQKRLDYVESQV